MGVVETIGRSLADGAGMFWQTLWALVLGFGLSGAVQAFISRAEMQRALGDHRPLTIAKAGFFGAVSSSCSYAASALAKTLFSRGADFTAAQAFMFASLRTRSPLTLPPATGSIVTAVPGTSVTSGTG